MAVKKKSHNVIKTRMKGLQYRISKQARQLLATHAPFHVRLEREPMNSHDPNAIAVWTMDKPESFHDMQLGYVAKDVAAVLAVALDSEDVRVTQATVTFLHAVEGEGELTIRLAKA
jgi:hypothetical protein